MRLIGKGKSGKSDSGRATVKKHAPATLRNREAIAAVLANELPANGTVLEVAAGSGEHACYFAARFAQLTWLPSDPDPEALLSIAAYREDYEGSNLDAPLRLDASAPDTWPTGRVDAVVCINMVHISPWEASVGLFEGAAKCLAQTAPLILYGPYFEETVETAPSNLDFDASLKARDPQWGIRHVSKVDQLGRENGLARSKRYEMPANNLTLIYRCT